MYMYQYNKYMFNFIDIYSFIPVSGCVGMVPGALFCSVSKMCVRDLWRVEPKKCQFKNLTLILLGLIFRGIKIFIIDQYFNSHIDQ